jgi:hypothetical protein
MDTKSRLIQPPDSLLHLGAEVVSRSDLIMISYLLMSSSLLPVSSSGLFSNPGCIQSLQKAIVFLLLNGSL